MATEVTTTPFSSLAIDDRLKKGITVTAGYKTLTTVQEKSIPTSLSGVDVLARARTGSGKTCAFLIPAIQKILTSPQRGFCRVLIISPVRELALQIQEEAQKFCTYAGVKTAAFVGGIKINRDKNTLARTTPELLVVTPGRLLDHCENTARFKGILKTINTFILDECDRLLDMGFRDEIAKALNYLNMHGNAADRQTLLFSATVPQTIQHFSRTVLKKNMKYIDCVGDDKTHVHVDQFWFDTTMDEHVSDAFCMLKHYWHLHTSPKIMVFFATARHTQYMADLFNQVRAAWKPNIQQIHSRLSQSRRKNVYEKFKKAKSGILFSSDVSARGMDYPDVTFILQMGITNKQQYIHRLGRTARIGKQGTGVIMLTEDERFVRTNQLRGLPVTQFKQQGIDFEPQPELEATLDQVAGNGKLANGASMAYRAWLGFHNGNLRKLGWSKSDLVSEAANFARNLGLTILPQCTKRFVGKTGLKGTPGLCIENTRTAGPIMLGKRKRAGQYSQGDVSSYVPPPKRARMSPRNAQTVTINGQQVTIVPMDQGQPMEAQSEAPKEDLNAWFKKTITEEVAKRSAEKTLTTNRSKWVSDRVVDILGVFMGKQMPKEEFWTQSQKWFDIEFDKASRDAPMSASKGYFIKQVIAYVRKEKVSLREDVYSWAQSRASEMDTAFASKSLSQSAFWTQSAAWLSKELAKVKISYPSSSPYTKPQRGGRNNSTPQQKQTYNDAPQSRNAKRAGGKKGSGSLLRFKSSGKQFIVTGQTNSKKQWKLQGSEQMAKKSEEGNSWNWV